MTLVAVYNLIISADLLRLTLMSDLMIKPAHWRCEMRELTENEVAAVSGGDFDGTTFMKGLGFAVGGAITAVAVPFLGAGALAAFGIAASAGVLVAGGGALMTLSTAESS